MLPKSPEDLIQLLESADEDTQVELSNKITDDVIKSDVFGDSEDVWIVRQLLKYVEPKKHQGLVNFLTTSITSETKDNELKERWLGRIPDMEGAVIMMENNVNDKGWTYVLKSNAPTSLYQRLRILRIIQEKNKESLFYNTVYNTSLTPIKNDNGLTYPNFELRDALNKWKNPLNWLNRNELDSDDKCMLWSIYAYCSRFNLDMSTLLDMSSSFGLSMWVSEQIIKPVDPTYYAVDDYESRYNYVSKRFKIERQIKNLPSEKLPELGLNLENISEF